MIRGLIALHLLARLLCGGVAGLVVIASPARAQEIFASPDGAATALVEALRGSKSPRLYSILGLNAQDILASGDEVRDKNDRERFVAAYDARHSIVETGRTATLLVGPDAFPFPIPMVETRGGWKFLAEAGRREMVARRIGQNELAAMQTSLAIADAQFEYASQSHDGQATGTYAQRIVSRPETQDGLYWPTASGEAPSPLGELAARAAAEGYTADQTRQPFHGYYFKVLKRQGPAAPGGALDYVVRGRMIGGFALLAYPAEHGRSGLTSFMISHAGTLYQKDLGPDTRRIAVRMQSFDPGKGWEKLTPEKP